MFGVGMAKTGTHSIAEMLGEDRYGFHEKNSARTLPLIISYINGKSTIQQLSRWLKFRDIHLYPILDVAHYYGAIVDELAHNIFPDAKFIVTIRDCYSCVQSQLNQIIKRWSWKDGWESDCDYFVRYYRELYGYSREWSYPPQEEILADAEVPPLDRMFRHWGERNRKLLEAIPSDRRLVIRTRELSQSIDRIERFTGVPSGYLRRERSHSFKRPRTFIDVFEEVPPEHIEKVAQRYCSDIMEEWFPEIQSPRGARK